MHYHRHPDIVRRWRILALIGILLCPACERQAPAPPQPAAAGEICTFTGTWTTIGHRRTVHLGGDRQASIFNFTGSMLLGGPQRLKRGFKAEVIGLADSLSGMQGRCVWTDEQGEKVFSELHGAAAGFDQPITGRFIGGTGRYARVSGEYTFKWLRLVDTEDGEVSGRVVDLKGWARLGPAEVRQPAPGGGQ